MARIAAPWWLRAEGAVVHWPTVARRQLAQQGDLDPARAAELARLAERRGAEAHLRWAAARDLGLPLEPWMVWMRPAKDRAEPVERVEARRAHGGLRLRWGFVAAVVEVDCAAVDPSRPVALIAGRTGATLRDALGAAADHPDASGQVRLTVRCAGATSALLVNGRDPVVRCVALQALLDDDGWEPLELVGLPVDDPWPDTAYATGPQGLVSAPVEPRIAALERLRRGAPPIGWWPVTESGRQAPDWRPPDHGVLLEEVRRDVVAQVGPLFAPGILPPEQRDIGHAPAVAPPTGAGGRTSSLKATAELPLLAVVALPAASDPHLALALGFGTAYGAGELERVGAVDFLVTGEYAETPDRTGRTTVCAYVPVTGLRTGTPAPVDLTAVRAGLAPPEVLDGPWRESVRVSWKRALTSAALGRPASASIARFPATAPGPAESLLPLREAGDHRPLLIVPDGPEGTPAHERTGMTDAGAVIPLGSGGRQVGYAVAVQDVFGIWSRWEDVPWTGGEPAPPPPRIVSVAMAARHEGSTVCPATVEVELAVEWDVRRPLQVELALAFFPMSSAAAAPPSGLGPVGPAPVGGFRLTHVRAYGAGERLGTGADVIHLDARGDQTVDPPYAVTQGPTRRYRLAIGVPTLDFGTTARWGVQVWARSVLAPFAPVPTGWSPGPAQPALAQAASPVPAEPLLPPPLPGVPLGSTPDAEGRSHVRVAWSLPGGADAAQCVVWEVSETALRQRAGAAPRAPEGTVPGQRLVDLRALYDALSPEARRSAFRRVDVLPGGAREADVALPRGSTDIHLFAVTTVTSTGVESPWPAPSPAHTALRAFMAPRLRRPAAPQVRSRVQDDGSVVLDLATASAVPVERFLLFRTRSPVAARSPETMGPAFASVVVAGPSGTADPATGELPYAATHTVTLPAGWDEWLLRAVAVPVATVAQAAVRGLPSPASDVVPVLVLPAGPPDLAPLVHDEVTASGPIAVRTSTDVRPRPTALGSHRASADAGGPAVAPAALEDLAEDAAPQPGPALVRTARAGGRTPLVLWVPRPDPAQPVDVAVRLADPLGRVTERRLTVPGWVPPAPEPGHVLELLEILRILGRGVVVRLHTDAPFDGVPPYALDVTATPLRRPSRFPFPPPRLPVRASFALHELPDRVRPGRPQPIQAGRVDGERGPEVQLLVRVRAPYALRVALRGPDGVEAEVSTRVS